MWLVLCSFACFLCFISFSVSINSFFLVVVVAAGGSHAGASSGVVLRVSPWILDGSFRQYPFRSPENFWFSQPRVEIQRLKRVEDLSSL